MMISCVFRPQKGDSCQPRFAGQEVLGQSFLGHLFQTLPRIGGSRDTLKRAAPSPKGGLEERYSPHTEATAIYPRAAYVRGGASSFQRALACHTRHSDLRRRTLRMI